jgi:hypothetical protein
VEIKNTIITIVYLIIKYFFHRDLLADENVELDVSSINFVTSNFLNIGN